MISIKDQTVKLLPVVHILISVSNAFTAMGYETIITSGNDGTHMKGSRHYTNEALDFRTHHIPNDKKVLLVSDVIGRLGKGYFAFLENKDTPNEHLHAELN